MYDSSILEYPQKPWQKRTSMKSVLLCSRFLQFVLCEVLNFANVIFQIILTNVFLGHEFTRYGREVIRFVQNDDELRTDPMSKVSF